MSGRGRHGAMLADKSRTRPARHLLGILWSYLRLFKKRLVVISIIVLAYTLTATFQPILVQQGLDLVARDGINTQDRELIGIIIIFSVLSVLVWIFQSLNTWVMADISTTLVHSVRSDTFKSLVEADMAYHHKNQSGNITSRVVSDTSEVAMGLTVFTQATTQILLIISTLIVLVYISWVFILISLLAVPIAFLLAKFLGSIGKKRMLATRQAYGHVSGKLAENLAGVSIAKSFNQEDRVSDEIRELNDKAYDYMKQLYLVFILAYPAIGMVSTFLVFGILLAGGYISATTSVTIGTIYLGTVMVQRFLMPLTQLANNYTQLQASLAAIDRIADVLEAEPSVSDSLDAVPLIVQGGNIEFQNVSFEYESDSQVLKDVSFKVKPGHKVALVGHTGAGKTTVTSLLMRFYDPTNGSIRIDDQDIKNVQLSSLYQNISLVSQEPYLFADTVLENIRYGKPSAKDEDIYDLCSLLGADAFIEALPNSYNTILQESGKSLSAGQRQMITIARTMLSDPKILVLDEATSRLDAYSESLVQTAQKILFEGRTTLIIAHRLSTIRDVDEIIVLDHGEISEMGNHDTLMLNKQTYYELYNMYYAHQGVKPLQIAEVSSKGTEVSYLNEGGALNVSKILEDRIDFAKEQSGSKITYNNTNGLSISGDLNKFKKAVDGVFHQISQIQKMHNFNGPSNVSTQKADGRLIIEVTNPEITIPEKMLKMMIDPNSGSKRPGGKNLASIVKEASGKLNILSPLPDTNKGTKWMLEFS